MNIKKSENNQNKHKHAKSKIKFEYPWKFLKNVIAPIIKRKMKCLRKFQRIKIKSFEIMTKISKTSNKPIKVWIRGW